MVWDMTCIQVGMHVLKAKGKLTSQTSQIIPILPSDEYVLNSTQFHPRS